MRLQLTPLPASEETLALFVAELAQTQAHLTIKKYLSAVRHLHVYHGLGNPLKDTLRLDLILRGVQKTKPKGTRTRLSVTPRILRSIKSSYDSSSRFDSTMWRVVQPLCNVQSSRPHEPHHMTPEGTCSLRTWQLTAISHSHQDQEVQDGPI